MYHPQCRRILESFTYSDSAAQDEQNEYLHDRIPSIVANLEYWALKSSKLA